MYDLGTKILSTIISSSFEEISQLFWGEARILVGMWTYSSHIDIPPTVRTTSVIEYQLLGLRRLVGAASGALGLMDLPHMLDEVGSIGGGGGVRRRS